jgi:8-oxo-dGTP pyrophosphatase MutT (NUDIX family)
MSAQSGPIVPWRVVSSETLIQDKWVDLRADTCVDHQGQTISPYYVLTYPDWVQVVCLTDDDELIIVEQYRHATRGVFLELPGGAADANEAPLDAAQRELQEETGIIGKNWVFLGQLSANPALQTNAIHVFGCRVHSVGPRALDLNEDINWRAADRAEISRSIKTNASGQLLHVGSLHLASLADFWAL